MHLLIWLVTALLLGLWSLFAWGMASVLAMDSSWLGDLRPLLEDSAFSGVLDAWLPGWRALAQAMLDLAQVLLGWLGSSAGWLAGAVWIVWAVGAVLLLGLAGLLSLVWAGLRKSSAPRADARLSA